MQENLSSSISETNGEKENPRNLLITTSYADLSAEREGFEPPVPLSTVVFKTTVIDHSTISPNARLPRKRVQR